MDEPSLVDKARYLAGGRAPSEHRHWVEQQLQQPDRPMLGVLLSVPNAVVAIVVAAASLLFGDSTYALVLVVLAVVVLASGAIPAVRRLRVGYLARRNGFTTSG